MFPCSPKAEGTGPPEILPTTWVPSLFGSQCLRRSCAFCFLAGLLREAELFHQGFRLRIVTTEVAVDDSLIDCAALLKDFLAECV